MNPERWSTIILFLIFLQLLFLNDKLGTIRDELQKMNLETNKVARLLIASKRSRQGTMSTALKESPAVRPDMTGSAPQRRAYRGQGAKTVLKGGEPHAPRD
jgi:hypothetical protein